MTIRRLAAAVVVGVATVASISGFDDRALLADRVMHLTRTSPWKLVSSVPMKFPTFHPQGMVRIGDTF